MLGWLSLATAAFMVLSNLPWHKPGCQVVIGERARIERVLTVGERFDEWSGEDDVHHRVCGVTRDRALMIFELVHPKEDQ